MKRPGWRLVPVVLAASLIVAGAVHAQVPPDDTASLVARAKRAAQQKDVPEALKYYREAGARGDATSQRALGDLYRDGVTDAQGAAVLEPDAGQSAYWYGMAAEAGDADAQTALADLYEHGGGKGPDYALAMFWYLKAAQQGDATAEGRLGGLYECDVPEVNAELNARFQVGDYFGAKSLPTVGVSVAALALMDAERKAARLYGCGVNGAPDYAAAKAWYDAAITGKDTAAAYLRARLFDVKLAIDPQNDADTKPVTDDLKAACADRRAQYAEGVLEETANPSSALAAYESAANSGYAPAQEAAGSRLLMKTKPLPKDYEEASRFLIAAAAQGVIHADYQLGLLYWSGNGVDKKDQKKAWGLLLQAAAAGDADAQDWVGNAYSKGSFPQKDAKEAQRWFTLAAAGNQDAADQVKKSASKKS